MTAAGRPRPKAQRCARDWWHPPTITGTRIGIEDLLYAIGNGGVLAVLYTIVFRQGLERVQVVPSLPFYWLMEAVLPGFIEASWYLNRLSGVLLLHIPLEDLVWYLYTGALWGIYYKFYAGLRLAPRTLLAWQPHIN